jgi:hypothetical protein
MRKVMAGALAAVALSWASAAQAADDAAKERREAADATKEQVKREGREAKTEAREQSQHAKESAGQAADRTRAEGSQARAGGAGAEKKHPLFEGKNNFDVSGKVAEVSASSITIQRNDLPSAKLHVSTNTKVEVDGQKASVQQLKRGQDVKASFNLQGDKAEAVEIKADKLAKGDQKELREQGQETRKEMNERARDAQQQR